MAKTIKESFDTFSTRLEITDKQGSAVSTCRSNVLRSLEKELSLHPEKSKLIGSYDRSTQIRYLSDGDIDNMIILHHKDHVDWHNPSGTIKALDKFKAILENTYPSTSMRRDENCITIQFTQFRFDVVPAFKIDNGRYQIPDSVRQKWVETDPFAFASLVTKTNKAMNNSFVPLIKMVKGWNREVGSPIRGFHLECIMYERYKNYLTGYTYDSMLRSFFEELPYYLTSSCYDPITYDRVDSYLDNDSIITKRQLAINKAKKAAEKSKEAYNDQEKYPITSIGEWKELLGEFFPAYG